ncbi:MAG: protein of unknown function DUF2188 [uncultured bacterium (gcode 4)]|uniref:DUF2188 domain-containing protein n=1 Tax=uncultured bacterium (gcode 4) TaxID=1234023 RepID=K2FYI1_9BACT|nr:MAG: protein of unknown function DUF2188 [uncultured bacterium (gcode 4)]
MKKNQHIVPIKIDWKIEWWRVLWEWNSKPSYITKTQKEAIDLWKDICKNQKSELIIHDKDNKFRDRDSYWNDPANIPW